MTPCERREERGGSARAGRALSKWEVWHAEVKGEHQRNHPREMERHIREDSTQAVRNDQSRRAPEHGIDGALDLLISLSVDLEEV